MLSVARDLIPAECVLTLLDVDTRLGLMDIHVEAFMFLSPAVGFFFSIINDFCFKATLSGFIESCNKFFKYKFSLI